MPAEMKSQLAFIFAAQQTNNSDVLFVTTFYQWATLGTFLNTHALDQEILGNLLFKLTPLFLDQSKQPSVLRLCSPTLCRSKLVACPGWCMGTKIAIAPRLGCCGSTWSKIQELQIKAVFVSKLFQQWVFLLRNFRLIVVPRNFGIILKQL